MIARIVHNHTPENQLTYPFFTQFLIESPSNYSINIDVLPNYSEKQN